LGLELVGRYLAEDPDLSLAEMLERLKATPGLQDEAIDLDEQQLQNTFSTAQRGVKAAFELSWQELDPVTQYVAQFLSLFAPTLFLRKWVESATDELNCTQSDIKAAKKQLYKRHLIQRVEEREGGYKIHPLIRVFLQAKLAASEQAGECRRAFLAASIEITRNIQHSFTGYDFQSLEDAIPQLKEVVQAVADVLKYDDLNLVLLCELLDRFYESQGLYALAESWRKQGLELKRCRCQLGVIVNLTNWAGFYESQGRYSEAEPLYVQALTVCEEVLGINHPITITIREDLALLQQTRSTSCNSSLRTRGLLAPFNLVKRFTQFLKRAAKNLD
jgi:tetratricopeptide (TPR) repeat protein